MRRRLLTFGSTMLVLGGAIVGVLQLAMAQQAPDGVAAARFEAIDVYLDSAEPLAAWQFELTEATGSMTIVGIENGESEAYAGTPLYDLEAVAEDRADRIVVADYSLADRTALPSGRTRIATVHVRLSGNLVPDYELNLIAAGDAEGRSIPAVASLERG